MDEAIIGWIGRLHPQLAGRLDLDPATCVFELDYAALASGELARFTPISRFPSIRRDLAVVIDAGIEADAVLAQVRAAAGELLADLVIFDVYQGQGVEKGRKSMAFGLILQDYSRTLNEQDVESVVARVTERLRDTLGGTLRE
jgi:phenylalanyl-tRNA synthetase beta chain